MGTAFPESTLTLKCMAFDLAIPLLGIYPKEIDSDVHMCMRALTRRPCF